MDDWLGRNVDRHREQLISWSQLLSRSMAEAVDLASGLEALQSQLGRMESKLPALRARIAPLQERSEQASRADRHIDAAVAAARLALERLERLRWLERAIEGGDPQLDIAGYLSAVAALEELQGNAAGCRGEDEQRLVEIAADKLEGEFQRLVRESSSVCDYNPCSSASEGGKSPRMGRNSSRRRRKGEQALAVVALEGDHQTLDKLQMILKKMVVLVAGGLERCVRVYQQERVKKLRQSSSLVDWITRSYGKKSPQHDNEQQLQSEDLILEWNGHLETAITIVYTAEIDLCSKVFGDVLEPWEVNECFARIAGPSGMHTLLEFGESFVRWDRQQQHQTFQRPDKIFQLLDMYSTLQQLGVTISQQLFAGKGECSTQVRIRARELHKLAVDSASKLFWGFKNQLIRSHQTQHYMVDLRAPQDAGVDKLSSYVVNYVKAVTSDCYVQTMEQVLQIEQSWKDSNPLINSAKPREFQQQRRLILEQAIVEMIASLEDALAAKSRKWYKDLVHQRIFLMNNAYYVFTRVKKLKIQPPKSGGGGGDTIRQLALTDSWLKDRRSKVQEHALAYQKEGWGKVLGQLSRQGLFLVSGAEAARQLVKQRLDGFTAALEETCVKHRGVGIPDQELRDATKAAVVHNIVPAYRSYLQSYGALIEASSVRFSAAEVEQTLTRLFDSMQC
ncbi:exocyst complex component EXO70A1-like [Selaginella moellendorffii]|uniref:exocyst complex component EXO70A1-like n=1 Tax=Selaginella moellendorffii TaxID=88036 RepID=UPI000D1CCC60|nr:exocyst complex component EXO70A1-like [Selaginella moellendorffii]|eukprot:XP_024545830.1 exocyst complex component EXO70A1-like [Selaginella moellendorffii]